MGKLKVCFWDVETTKLLVKTFSMHPDYISHSDIVEEWYIICGAWKIGNVIKSVAIDKLGNDKNVCQVLRDALADVSIIVHHNGDKFDIKKLNARLIFHKLKPLPFIPTVDTLKEARKIASFTSNRLDYLHKFLGGKGKAHTSAGLWDRVMDGDKKALKEMIFYNKRDVEILEDVYLRLRPYMKNHPHAGVMAGNSSFSCKNCGSVHVKKDGIRISATGIKKQQLKCLDCYSYSVVAMKHVK